MFLTCTSARFQESRGSRRSKARPSTPLRGEPLESRQLMAANLMLDFNGSTHQEIQRLVNTMPTNFASLESTHNLQTSFVGEFSALQHSYGGYSKFDFLDFDDNGVLDARDGERAVDQIMSQVKQDFAPYSLFVSRVDDTAQAIRIAERNSAHDAIIMVTGSHPHAGGQAPLDPGNSYDNAGDVSGSVGIAKFIADRQRSGRWSDRRAQDAFVNGVANIISHEAAHTFGLEHIDPEREPNARTLMSPWWGTRDNNFPDITYATEDGGEQNAHRYLVSTLGPSPLAWAAVLRPES